jgi:spore maturation protein CgeB
MKIAMFYHSLVSDWNHGNAHFLRGIAMEFLKRGHDVRIFEPRDAWSVQNLIAEQGNEPLREFHAAYPLLKSETYDLADFDLDRALDGTDLVLVHEWNDRSLVRRIGEHRARNRGHRLFFHDTHHRAVTAPHEMQEFDLSNYDGVLAYGNVLREIYLARGWAQRAWTWHEAADTSVFFPRRKKTPAGDVVWIGNWGDNERTAELHDFLIRPSRELRLSARMFGVRYPEAARDMLHEAGIGYGGWLANFRVPETFGCFRVTVHVPRKPYVERLPGIPTIRPFEAMATGTPLVCSPWEDAENLFEPGRDYLIARNGNEMKKHLRALIADKAMAREIANHGLATIHARHTCSHRVTELLRIYEEVSAAS